MPEVFEWSEVDIIAELSRTLSGYRPRKCLQSVSPQSSCGLLLHPKGQFNFITSLYKRFVPGNYGAAGSNYLYAQCVFGTGLLKKALFHGKHVCKVKHR